MGELRVEEQEKENVKGQSNKELVKEFDVSYIFHIQKRKYITVVSCLKSVGYGPGNQEYQRKYGSDTRPVARHLC